MLDLPFDTKESLRECISQKQKEIDRLTKELKESQDAYAELLLDFSSLSGQEEYIESHKDRSDESLEEFDQRCDRKKWKTLIAALVLILAVVGLIHFSAVLTI